MNGQMNRKSYSHEGSTISGVDLERLDATTVTIEGHADSSGTLNGNAQFEIASALNFARYTFELQTESSQQRRLSVKLSLEHPDEPFRLQLFGRAKENDNSIRALSTAYFQHLRSGQWNLQLDINDTDEENGRPFDRLQPGESFTFVITIYKLITELPSVMNDVILSAQADTDKVLCGGFSETTLRDVASYYVSRIDKTIIIGSSGDLSLTVTPLVDSFDISLNIPSGRFDVTIEVQFQINTGSDTVLRARGAMQILIRPEMVITHESTMTLVAENIQRIGEMSVDILDLSALLPDFPDAPSVVNYLEGLFQSLINAQPPFETSISAVLQSIPVPRFWNDIQNVTLTFLKFAYAYVHVQAGTPDDKLVGYIFALFEMRSSRTNPPCICNDELESIVRRQSPSFETLKPVHFRSPGFFRHFVPIPEYTVSALAMSQGALAELAHVYTPSRLEKRIERGGRVYFRGGISVGFSFIELGVTNTGFNTKVAIDGSGSVTAGVRGPCGGLSTSIATISISCANLEIVYSVNESFTVIDGAHPFAVYDIQFAPHVDIADQIQVHLDTNLPPMDIVSDLIINAIVNSTREQLENMFGPNTPIIALREYLDEFQYIFLFDCIPTADLAVCMLCDVTNIFEIGAV